MNESYVELLVKRKSNLAIVIGQGIFLVFAIISTCLFMLTMSVFLLISSLVLAGLFFLLKYNSVVEYEYLLLDKALSIDKIRCQSFRKKVAEFDLNNLEILAPASSHRLDAYCDRNDMKKKDFSTGEKDGMPYALVLRNGGILEHILIECNDDLLQHISRFAPRKVFKD